MLPSCHHPTRGQEGAIDIQGRDFGKHDGEKLEISGARTVAKLHEFSNTSSPQV
jgi:hypothetical protein